MSAWLEESRGGGRGQGRSKERRKERRKEGEEGKKEGKQGEQAGRGGHEAMCAGDTRESFCMARRQTVYGKQPDTAGNTAKNGTSMTRATTGEGGLGVKPCRHRHRHRHRQT